MKRYMAILGFVFVGILAGLLVRGIPIVVQVNAGGGGELPRGSQNGDVNGDSMLDMSDAVYLLIHLFNGGPEPIACADSDEIWQQVRAIEGEVEGLGGPLNRIADTFEMLAEADCNKRIDRFHWQENGTVIDTCKPLMWADRNFHAGENNNVRWTFDGATEFINNLDYSGYSDWRLPTVSELLSLINTSGQPFFGSTKNMPQFFISAQRDNFGNSHHDSFMVFSSYVGPENLLLAVDFRTNRPHLVSVEAVNNEEEVQIFYNSVIPVRDITPEG